MRARTARSEAQPGDFTRVWAVYVAILAVLLLGVSSWERESAASAPRFRLDPNTADPALLEVLPGLGPARVQAIVTARRQAPFRSLKDFQDRVRGIGPASSARLDPYLRFPAPAPARP